MRKKVIVAIVSSFVVLLGLSVTAASFAFTAPGFHVNGTDVGFSTQKKAIEKLHNTLSETPITVNDVEFTYEELGVTYDDKALQDFLNENKAYNVDSWNTALSHSIKIDESKMKEAVSKKLPNSYSEPTDADVVLNENGESWDVVEGKNGTMPIVEDLRKNIEKDLTATNITDDVKKYELVQDSIEPSITTKEAEEFTGKLNTMADDAGYYEGDEKKLDISRSSFAELVAVEKTEDGFAVVPQEDSLRNYAETVPDEVNTKVDNGSAVVDENGKVLKTLDEFNDGYEFNDVKGLTSRSIEQLSKGEGSKFQLQGKKVEAKVDEKFRRIDVDLDAREVRTYENEKLVKTYKVAIGKPATPTDKGKFKVFHQTKMMDMGCTPAYDYCTKDVPFATFYNGGEAFHGTWWHSDFGNTNASMRSHGCVNMTISDSEEIYYFAQTGTPVHVF